MSLILSLETSTQICSVAIHKDSNVVATAEVHIEQSHASKLALLIEQVIKFADVHTKELSAVAVSAGPGSYTGLRIGASTAKGLCVGLNIPMISINTLDLLAFQMKEFNPSEAYLCPMIDARRMEVYCLLKDAALNIVHPVEAKIIDELSFSGELKHQKIMFFGNGAIKCSNVIKHPNAQFVEGVYPQAIQLGALAYKKWCEGTFENVSEFTPTYLKEFVAKQAKSFF